jgi:peptidoglycan/LPS O-acetylase OafA/YrhL
MGKNLPALTSLRGIAALLVLVFHLRSLFGPLPTKFIEDGYLWVDFFFVLSGFVISHAYGRAFAGGFEWHSYRAFLRARFARIYPLHFSILAFVFAEELGRWYLIAHYSITVQRAPFSGTRDLWGLASNLLLLQAIGPLGTEAWNTPAWSISAEFLAYLAFPAVIALTTRRPRIAWLLALAVIAVVPAAYAATPEASFYIAPFRCVSEFTSGCLVYRLYMRGPIHPAVFLSALAILLGALHFGAYPAIAVVCFPLLVLGGAETVKGASILTVRPLVYLGEISYSVYLTQSPVYDLVGRVPKAIHLQGAASALFVIAAVVAVSAATYRWIERPARRWLLSPS